MPAESFWKRAFSKILVSFPEISKRLSSIYYCHLSADYTIVNTKVKHFAASGKYQYFFYSGKNNFFVQICSSYEILLSGSKKATWLFLNNFHNYTMFINIRFCVPHSMVYNPFTDPSSRFTNVVFLIRLNVVILIICTVTLCCVKQQIHSEFRHI